MPPKSNKSTNTTKTSRSRNGCSICRKSKIKCDELRPSCMNCIKANKSCDYSIKLTWGGRPYKNPKIEKLNPLASLSRQQLFESNNTNNSTGTDSTSTIPTKKKYNSKKIKTIIEPTLDPNDNLNNLIKLSKKNKNKKSQNQSFTFINEQNTDNNSNNSNNSNNNNNTPNNIIDKIKYNDPIIIKKENDDIDTIIDRNIDSNSNTHTNIISTYPSLDPELAINPINDISNNLQTVNNILGSFFDEKLSSPAPWSLFEGLNTTNFSNDNLFDGTNVNNNVNNNTNILTTQNESLLFENQPELPLDDYKLNDFAFDLSKIQNLLDSSNNIHSIPMINESSKRRSHIDDDEEKEEEKEEEVNNSIIEPYNQQSITSTTSSVTEILESIPRGLLPLPDMLLNVPYYYESFLFFLDSTSSILTPTDLTIYRDNPFKIVLPKLAMTNEGLMSLIVAFGTAHRQSLLKIDANDIIESLLSRALSDLLILLNNKETCTSDLTLTIILFFSSFLAFNYNSDKWKVHMNGAKQIFLMRGYNKPFNKLIQDFQNDESLISGEIKKSKLLYFLIRWFAYIDIFANLSSPLEPTIDEILNNCKKSPNNFDSLSPFSDTFSSPNSNLINSPNITISREKIENLENNEILSDSNNENNNENNQIDYEVIETNGVLKEESHLDIDYMLGFKIKFLPIFSKLCKLIKYVNLIKRSNERMGINSVTLTPKIIESAINIQMKFQKLKYVEYDNTSNTLISKSINAIIASNHCFLLMGLIQLYKRVLLMPSNSKIIQEMSIEILNTLTKYLNTKEPKSLCVILPLFIAGCECQDISKRKLFLEKLNDFQQMGSVSADVAIDIMVKSWSTKVDWYTIMHEENKCVVFL